MQEMPMEPITIGTLITLLLKHTLEYMKSKYLYLVKIIIRTKFLKQKINKLLNEFSLEIFFLRRFKRIIYKYHL